MRISVRRCAFFIEASTIANMMLLSKHPVEVYDASEGYKSKENMPAVDRSMIVPGTVVVVEAVVRRRSRRCPEQWSVYFELVSIAVVH